MQRTSCFFLALFLIPSHTHTHTHSAVGSPGDCVVYCEPAYWCSVNYFEMKNHVGNVFYATKPFLIVDGFTSPNSLERFSLGVFTNVHQDSTIERVRQHIGKGIQLMYVGGEVFVESLCNYNVFIHSPIANLIRGDHPAQVYKAEPGSCTKVFNLMIFAQCLKESIPRGFMDVFKLTNMCSIRLSFIKGWGAEYQRKTISTTPCWIEIHLSGALQWLDKVLIQMQAPTEGMRSNT